MEEVTTILVIEGYLEQDLRTFSVPLTAGSINSTWKENGMGFLFLVC